MKKAKTKFETVKEWIFLIIVVAVVGAVIGMISDLLSNGLTAHSWREFLTYTIISAVGGVILMFLYLIYSFISEKIHKKHPTWFAPQDPPSKK
ncbi:hypothetical protein AKUH3B209X_01010 [Apilactobacillus kunkeei]|nr:hypothetical protein AKUH3B209X_01010 [Apilactobacillus kunkeei]